MISGTRHARSRRHALRLVVAIAVVAVCRAPVATSAAEGDEDSVAVRPEESAEFCDLDTIKQRILAPLLTPVDAATVRRLIDTLQADGSWPNIDYQETQPVRLDAGGAPGKRAPDGSGVSVAGVEADGKHCASERRARRSGLLAGARLPELQLVVEPDRRAPQPGCPSCC